MGVQCVQHQVQERARIVLVARVRENLQVAARTVLEEQRGRVAAEGDRRDFDHLTGPRRDADRHRPGFLLRDAREQAYTQSPLRFSEG